MKIATWLLALTLLATTPALAEQQRAARTQAEVEETVLVLLSGYEFVPKAADWARAGTPDQVATALIKLASAKGSPLARTHRALASLAQVPTPEVRAFLLERAADKALQPRTRGRALMALGAGFKDAAAQDIAPYLVHEAPRLREDAVRALRPMASTAVEALLKQRAAAEPLAHIKAQLASVADRVEANRGALEAQKLPVPTIAPLTLPKSP